MGSIVTAGLAAFGLMLALQVIAWRVFAVRREMLGLALVYLLLPACAAAAAIALAPASAPDVALSALLYLCLACGYIQTYPALREDIPTFRLLFALERAGTQGLTEADLVREVGDQGLYQDKLADLAADGLARIGPDGRLALQPAGRLLATAFSAYRRLLGLQRGHG
jgi:hypothetical protein